MSKSEDRRAQAAAARQASAAAEKRERSIRLIGTIAIIVVVAGIIGVGVMGSRKQDANPVTGTIPASVNQKDGSFVLNPSTSATAVMDLYEDFQCPGCKNFEELYADTYKQLADDNVVKVVFHPAAFLDNNFPGENSARAINAWGCAIDAGQAWAFHKALYASQPEKEGAGWTDAAFAAVAGTAGITGDKLTTFKKCVADKSYLKWSSVATQKFYDDGVQSTPTVKVNGVEAPNTAFASADEFIKWVKETAAK